MEKKKIIKIVLFIILIVILLFLGNIIRKMIIIKDINDKVSKYTINNNHYEKIINNSGETTTTTEYYCKDDKAVLFLTTKNKDTDNTRKLTQYFNGEKSNIYIEADNNKIAILNSNEVPNKVIIYKIDDGESLWNLFYLALITPIKSVDYRGKQCYFLDSPVARNSYIEKDTGLILRAIDGKVKDSNGIESDMVIEYYYEFDNVNDDIFVEPDISEYKIQENK